MKRVTICSAKGSPGVTTLSCVLGAVWPTERAVVIAECDPSGGDLAGRFGLSTRLGMTSLVLTERQRGSQPLDSRAHMQQLPGGLDVLVGPAAADAATALDHELAMSTCDVCPVDSDLLADCGRLVPGAAGQAKMISTSDQVLVLISPDVAGIARARWVVQRIRELAPCKPSAIVVGAGGFRAGELVDELDIDLLGVTPVDPRAALMACGAPGTAKEFIRSELVAFARETVRSLVGESVSAEANVGTMGEHLLAPEPQEGHRTIMDRLKPTTRSVRHCEVQAFGQTAPSS